MLKSLRGLLSSGIVLACLYFSLSSYVHIAGVDTEHKFIRTVQQLHKTIPMPAILAAALGWFLCQIAASATGGHKALKTGNRIFYVLLGVVFAPIVEEIIFRAPLIINVVAPSAYDGVKAILISSIAFGLLHYFNSDNRQIARAIAAFVCGIVLGIVALALRSIYLCIAVHGAINAVFLLHHKSENCEDCKRAESA